jgi:putative spermidine/putrescine transport system permease protein
VIYSLGAVTTFLSLAVIAVALTTSAILRQRQLRKGSDAGKGMV